MQVYSTVVFGGYTALMCATIVVVVRRGPQWRSGRPGDFVRFPRRLVIAGSIVGVALGLLLLGSSLVYFGSNK